MKSYIQETKPLYEYKPKIVLLADYFAHNFSCMVFLVILLAGLKSAQNFVFLYKFYFIQE